MGSAALALPQLDVAAASPRQGKEPIASLTKMMTTWLVLQEFPITNSENGACEKVSAADVALYKEDVEQEQSVVKIVKGQHICERTLLRGIFVHSAGDYAQLLANLTGLTQSEFVALMNREARTMGMDHTHYVDETGISPGDVSTAQDQTKLTVTLMTSEPVVRAVAALTKVWLPVAGVVDTYTPDLGQGGVVGVKSGWTTPAGGCDVMAIDFVLNQVTYTTYIVVLGEHSRNALALAGRSALNLFYSLRPSIARVRTPTGLEVEWIGSPSDVITTTPPPSS
jgi:D-alanyl-D-alanine carboxypeptidase (penicillin-binding protein 5/6)